MLSDLSEYSETSLRGSADGVQEAERFRDKVVVGTIGLFSQEVLQEAVVILAEQLEYPKNWFNESNFWRQLFSGLVFILVWCQIRYGMCQVVAELRDFRDRRVSGLWNFEECSIKRRVSSIYQWSEDS